jgi:hypothetical protein
MKRLALADLCSALQRGSRPKVSRWDCNEVCPSASCDMPRKHARHLNITRIYGSCSCNLLAIKNVDIFLELQPGDTIHSILMYSLSIIVYSQRQFVNIVNCIISLFDLYIDIRFLVKKHTESASHALTKLGRAASPRRRKTVDFGSAFLQNVVWMQRLMNIWKGALVLCVPTILARQYIYQFYGIAATKILMPKL